MIYENLLTRIYLPKTSPKLEPCFLNRDWCFYYKDGGLCRCKEEVYLINNGRSCNHYMLKEITLHR